MCACIHKRKESNVPAARTAIEFFFNLAFLSFLFLICLSFFSCLFCNECRNPGLAPGLFHIRIPIFPDTGPGYAWLCYARACSPKRQKSNRRLNDLKIFGDFPMLSNCAPALRLMSQSTRLRESANSIHLEPKVLLNCICRPQFNSYMPRFLE